jgi:hypothetical protein
MYKFDLLQMLHSTAFFQINGGFEVGKYKAMWTSFAGMEYEKPVKPNIGWWGAVGESL